LKDIVNVILYNKLINMDGFGFPNNVYPTQSEKLPKFSTKSDKKIEWK